MSLAGGADVGRDGPPAAPTPGPAADLPGGPDPTDDWTPSTDVALAPVAAPAVRAGPALLDADSWADPPPSDPTVSTYEGRRRANPPSRRPWVVITLVLLGLAAVVAIPLVLVTGGADRTVAAATTDPTGNDPTVDQPTTGAQASLVPATGAAAGTTEPPRPTTTARPRPTATTSTATTTTAAAAAPPFAAVTLEAEGPEVTVAGSAWVDRYAGASNGSIVRNLGRWDDNPGSVRWNNVSIPTAGAYVITIYFVHLDGEPTRTAQITVSGASPVTQTFNGSANCCASLALPAITLAAGPHTVTIGNPSGRAPSVDKIVISRP